MLQTVNDNQNWYNGTTFNDLKHLNLQFLYGNITETPYHGAPLDPESNHILDKLDQMHDLDMITVESQPYLRFPYYKNKSFIVEQFPYVLFYYPRDKTMKLNSQLSKLNGIHAIMMDFKKYKCDEIEGNYIENDYNHIIYDYNNNIVELQPSPFSTIHYSKYISDFSQHLGYNFIPLVENDLVMYIVNSTLPSNAMFDMLISAAYYTN